MRARAFAIVALVSVMAVALSSVTDQKPAAKSSPPAKQIAKSKTVTAEERTPITEWVRVFKKKVGEIIGGPSCPQ